MGVGVKKRATPSTVRITEAIVSRTAQISNRNTSRAARRDNAKAKGATNIFSSIFIFKTSFIYPSYLYFIMPARGHKCCERLCGGSANSAGSSESASAVVESTAAANTGVMYDFYRNVGENLKNGEVDGYDGYFTDSAMTFLAENDALFEKNEWLPDEEVNKIDAEFDLRDVLKNPDRYTSQLFYGGGIIADIREETLEDGTYVTEGLILCNGISSEEYCYFICSGSVPLYAGDNAVFVGLPLGVGNVDLTNNTKQRCVYVACAYMQSAEDAVNSGALLPDDTWEPVDDSNSSDDELNPISYEDKVINEVYGTVWDGWENYDPDHPEWDEITYGMVMDYLFEDSTYYQWSYDAATNTVILEGTYTTFDYTMGMADEPTACDVKLSFTQITAGDWIVLDYSGDEFDTVDEFLQTAYDFYYQGNCY